MATIEMVIDGNIKDVEIKPSDITTYIPEEDLNFTQWFYNWLGLQPKYQKEFLEANDLMKKQKLLIEKKLRRWQKSLKLTKKDYAQPYPEASEDYIDGYLTGLDEAIYFVDRVLE